MVNPITLEGTVRVYLVQHPNGAVRLKAGYNGTRNSSGPDHFKVLAETEFVVTLTGDAGVDPNRTYPRGGCRAKGESWPDAAEMVPEKQGEQNGF